MSELATDQRHSGLREEDAPTLLVVDDDPDILRVVHFYLTKQRYQVHTAASGEEALELLRREPEVELILSDVMMPAMSGLDLLQAVRDDPRLSETPVILISAEGETSKKVTGLNLGADDFITKPFNFDELMARVRNHIRLRRLQKELVVASRQVMEANEQLQRQNQRFVEDLEAARGAQMALMPDAYPEVAGVRLASRYLPAERLGGDFFDMVPLDGGRKLGILVADVCGHGIAAAFITAMTKISFQSACGTSLEPGDVLATMNRELNHNLKSGFVTAFYAIYDIETRELAYASGGHPPLLVYRRASGEVESLAPQATFLGVFEPVDFPTARATLEPGDRVVFYTDGLYESRNEAGEPFGLEAVYRAIAEAPDLDVQDGLDRLIDSLINFTDGTPFEDDITLVGLDVAP